nr:hypothetical protein [uncultured Rhodoferax sp.]
MDQFAMVAKIPLPHFNNCEVALDAVLLSGWLFVTHDGATA